jgi:hypothetical protein
MDDWNWPKAFSVIAFMSFLAFMAVTYKDCVIENQKIHTNEVIK